MKTGAASSASPRRSKLSAAAMRMLIDAPSVAAFFNNSLLLESGQGRLRHTRVEGGAMRERLWRRALLNPDVFAGCEELNPGEW